MWSMFVRLVVSLHSIFPLNSFSKAPIYPVTNNIGSLILLLYFLSHSLRFDPALHPTFFYLFIFSVIALPTV